MRRWDPSRSQEQIPRNWQLRHVVTNTQLDMQLILHSLANVRIPTCPKLREIRLPEETLQDPQTPCNQTHNCLVPAIQLNDNVILLQRICFRSILRGLDRPTSQITQLLTSEGKTKFMHCPSMSINCLLSNFIHFLT